MKASHLQLAAPSKAATAIEQAIVFAMAKQYVRARGAIDGHPKQEVMVTLTDKLEDAVLRGDATLAGGIGFLIGCVHMSR